MVRTPGPGALNRPEQLIAEHLTHLEATTYAALFIENDDDFSANGNSGIILVGCGGVKGYLSNVEAK